MKRILIGLFAALLAFPALGQIPGGNEIAIGRTPVIGGTNNQCLYVAAGKVGNQACGGSGTVTSVSVTTANGVSGSVATATTTPAITLTLGAITPTTVNGITLTAAGSSAQFLNAAGTYTRPSGGQIVSSKSGAVQTGTTALPFDDTAPPQSSEGDEYYTVTITPVSASSTLLIQGVLNFSHTTALTSVTACIFQDAIADALACSSFINTTATGIMSIPIFWTMTSGTTSATTFKLRAGGATGATMTVNGTSGGRQLGGAFSSGLVVQEKL